MATTHKIKLLNPRHPDTKYMGDEPQWQVQPTENRSSRLGRAFNWYTYFYGKKEAKDMLAAYLDINTRTREAKKIRSLPDSKIILTAGWLSRMATVGLELTEKEHAKLNDMIAEILQAKEEVKVEVAEDDKASRVTTIQDRLREKVSDCLGELEGLFDDFVITGAKLSADYKPVVLMRSMNIAPQMISMVKDVWTKKLAYFETVVEGKDSQLVQAYDHMTKTQLKNCVKFCELVLADCGSYVQIKKVERKPRKIKPVSPEKKAAKFRILQEFAELGLKSLPATQLVDKAEAWLYDSKKRKLIHVVADDYAKVFTVKNNTIIGFNTVETVQKTLRKPAEQLKAITTVGKPAARKAFKDIKATETQWKPRGSEHLLILRAW